jgi:putative ABC transport system ATP-binding protein
MTATVETGPSLAQQPAAQPPIVEARAVQRVYDTGKVRVAALQGVDLTVRRGEVVSVMGPSGCG